MTTPITFHDPKRLAMLALGYSFQDDIPLGFAAADGQNESDLLEASLRELVQIDAALMAGAIGGMVEATDTTKLNFNRQSRLLRLRGSAILCTLAHAFQVDIVMDKYGSQGAGFKSY